LLVHICCSVDSHFFLQQLRKDYPDEQIVGFFYDPNIHPYSEYILRLEDVKYSCEKLGIILYEGQYDIENWLQKVKGFEDQPEKAHRCTICFDRRLDISAKKTIELGFDKFTTTLLMSPLKSQEKLKIIGDNLAQKYDIRFIFKDYRAGQGSHLQALEVKQNNIYRQNYCGCMFALNQQREYQQKLCDELISPINQQILPESIEERLKLYRQRTKLENQNQNYKIIKERFLNYRLLQAYVKHNKQTIPSYFLFYSTLQKKQTKGKVEFIQNNIGYFNKNEVKIISLQYLNQLLKTNYKNIYQLIYLPPNIEQEIQLRDTILSNPYDLCTIIVLETITQDKLEIYCDSKIYEDVKERII
jgi:predicted adenine nucleotide alpha hydrolase (AANH) superfamily ATPase